MRPLGGIVIGHCRYLALLLIGHKHITGCARSLRVALNRAQCPLVNDSRAERTRVVCASLPRQSCLLTGMPLREDTLSRYTSRTAISCGSAFCGSELVIQAVALIVKEAIEEGLIAGRWGRDRREPWVSQGQGIELKSLVGFATCLRASCLLLQQRPEEHRVLQCLPVSLERRGRPLLRTAAPHPDPSSGCRPCPTGSREQHRRTATRPSRRAW